MTRTVNSSFFSLLVSMVLGCILLSPVALGAQARQDIDVRAPITQKYIIAVPHLVSGDAAQGTALAGQAEQSLRATGLFTVLDPGTYNAASPGSVTPPRDRLQYYAGLGCNLVIVGGVQPAGPHVALEMRLYDPGAGQMLLGKRYQGPAADRGRMVNQFVDEVVRYLTGKAGVPKGRLAFISGGTDARELYVMDIGGTPRQLTRFGTLTLTPAWTPDGQEIIVCSYRGGYPALYAVNAASGAVRKLKSHGTLNVTPAAGPGGLVAATLNKDRDQEVYLLDRSGNITRRLTNSRGIDISPAFSPDGRQLAFVSNRAGGPQVFVVGAQGGEPRRLTYGGNYNVSPAWSPKGDLIAYAGRVGGRFQIFTIPAGGGGARQLSHDGGNESPTWSPDGNFIACSSTRDGQAAIYVINVGTGAATRVTTMPGIQTQPAWCPR